MIKRVIVWLIRKGLDIYPEETILPSGTHLHSNPKRKLKLTEAATLKEIYPEGKE
jgi:hypothetical protein